MHNLFYVDQMKIDNLKGALKPSHECFPSSAAMFISWKNPNFWNMNQVNSYIDDVEANAGKTGIAETVKGWSGRSGAWWIVHLAAIRKYLPFANVIWDTGLTVEKLKLAVSVSPVLYSANKIGGLPGGYMFVVVDYNKSDDTFTLYDPFGNPNKNYSDRNGKGVKVTSSYLSKYADKYGIYIHNKAFGNELMPVKKKIVPSR